MYFITMIFVFFVDILFEHENMDDDANLSVVVEDAYGNNLFHENFV